MLVDVVEFCHDGATCIIKKPFIQALNMAAFFPEIEKIRYEGPRSKNLLAFRWYNPDEVVEGKTMRDHLRFSVVYWHTFRGSGSDPFGPGTMLRPWDDGSDS